MSCWKVSLGSPRPRWSAPGCGGRLVTRRVPLTPAAAQRCHRPPRPQHPYIEVLLSAQPDARQFHARRRDEQRPFQDPGIPLNTMERGRSPPTGRPATSPTPSWSRRPGTFGPRGHVPLAPGPTGPAPWSWTSRSRPGTTRAHCSHATRRGTTRATCPPPGPFRSAALLAGRCSLGSRPHQCPAQDRRAHRRCLPDQTRYSPSLFLGRLTTRHPRLLSTALAWA